MTKSNEKIIKLAEHIACGVLLLALIVVSAFAYQWHTENRQLKKDNVNYRALADTNTLQSINNENFNLQSELNAANSKIAEYEKLISDYEAILTENDLMPEE